MSSERSVTRCWNCNLNQFSGITCRRCREPLEKPRVEETVAVEGVTPKAPPTYHETIVRQIARRIKAARLAKKMSQNRLAKQLHCQRTYVSKVENGVVLPTIQTLERLSIAMGIQVLDLIESKREVQTRKIFNDQFICELLDAGKGMPVFFWKKTADAAGRLSNVR